MAGKKSKSSGKISMGGRTEAHKRQEEKRQAYFKKRRENGENYAYKPNPYKPGTSEYEHERLVRAEKNKNQRLPYAKKASIFAKLDNWLAKQNEIAKAMKN